MKKIFKFFMLQFIISLFLLTSVNAFNINMNLENTTSTDTTNIVEEAVSNNLSENKTPTIDDTELDNDSSPRVTTIKTTDEDEFLTIENILSVIIIVIGILLIFLAIAILIRFK